MIKLAELTRELAIPNNMRVKMSHGPIVLDKGKTYEQQPTMKPRGFWYGFGNEWIEWVRGNMPEWEGNYLYEVDIKHSNVLLIESYYDLVLFDKTYAATASKHGFPRDPGEAIDWAAVSKKYDGVEIYPYERGNRHQHSWYSTWNVASGCIWNLSHIELKQIEPKL